MGRTARQITLPEGIEDTWDDYNELNPAYDLLSNDPRIVQLREIVIEELNEIFYHVEKDDRGKVVNLRPRSSKSIEERLATYQEELKIRIRGLLNNHLWETKLPATEDEFEACSRTIIKTLEEILSHKTERMAFDREEPEVTNGEAMKSFNISPKQITDTLLRNLGLSEYIPSRDLTPPERMAKRGEAVHAVREKVSKLEPIRRSNETDDSGLKYFRLMRIPEGEGEGMILGTQIINDKKILFRTSLDALERRMPKIEQSQADEIKAVKFIELTLKNIKENLTAWLDLDQEDIDKIKAALLECVNSLESITNEHKKLLRYHVKQCLTLKDRRGRYNPTITKDRLDRAIPFAGLRVKEIGEIWRYIGNDKGRVQEIKSEAKLPLLNFCTQVEDMHAQFALLKPAEGHRMDARKKASVLRNLEARKTEAAKLTFEPYLSFGRKFIEQIDKVKAMLDGNDFDGAAREFMKLYLITKMDKAYEHLADVHYRVSVHGDLVNPAELKTELEAKKKEFKSRPVATDIEIEEYNKAYGEVMHLYAKLIYQLKKLDPKPVAANTEQTQTAKKEKRSIDQIIGSLAERLSPKLNAILGDFKARLDSFMIKVLRTGTPPRKMSPVRVGSGGETILPQAAPSVETTTEPAEETFTPELKAEVYGKIRARLKEFDFGELARNLPDTPTAPIAPPATAESAAS